MHASQPEFEPAAPPTEPVEVRRQPLTTVWPTLLGVVSAVLGVVGLLQGAMSALSPIWLDMVKKVAPNTQVHMLGVMRSWASWAVTSGALSSVLSLILVIGGVGIAMRRPWGVKLQLIWAVLKIVWTPVVLWFNVQMQMEQMKASQVDAAGAGAPVMPFAGMVEEWTYLCNALLLLWMWVLPVVSIMWLMSKRARAEITTWARSSANPQALAEPGPPPSRERSRRPA